MHCPGALVEDMSWGTGAGYGVNAHCRIEAPTWQHCRRKLTANDLREAAALSSERRLRADGVMSGYWHIHNTTASRYSESDTAYKGDDIFTMGKVGT